MLRFLLGLLVGWATLLLVFRWLLEPGEALVRRPSSR
jgi:hypothetical protein